jgi:hypothetical protein
VMAKLTLRIKKFKTIPETEKK